MNEKIAKETADRIVEELFRNGMGQKARRLVLELENGRSGGGWAKGPVRDVIIKHIVSTLSQQIKKG